MILTLVYFDDDLLEFDVKASNGHFAGICRLYADHTTPLDFANCLTGFPKSPKDLRNFEMGTFQAESAGGGARFLFGSRDNLGHCFLKITLHADPREAGEQTATFVLNLEQSAVDDFVKQLRSFALQIGFRAELKCGNK